MKKIRVLHIISDNNIGGAGKLLFNLASSINKNKFEIIIAYPKNSKLSKIFDSDFITFKINCDGDKSFDIKSIKSLCKIIKACKPDIVHTHSSISGRIAARICNIKASKILYTKHCVFDFDETFYIGIVRFFYRLFDNMLAGHIVAVANSAKEELIKKGIDDKKIKVIINGSLPIKRLSYDEINDIKQILGIDENEFIVGIIARLESYKDHKTFINAAKLADKNNENIRFIIVGDGTLRNDLENLVKKEGIDKKVIFTGFSNDVYKYLNILDLNINCSVGTETSSLAISEGLSIGVPALVSNFGGNPNMVKEGVTGYIFPKSQYRELYQLIISIKNSPSIIQNLRKNAKIDYKNRFSSSKMASKYEELYSRIMTIK